MSAQVMHRYLRRPIHWESWALTVEADRRYRRIVAYVGTVFIVVLLLLSLFKLEEKEHEQETFNSIRYAQLLKQPKPEPPKVEEPPAPPQEQAKAAPKAETPPKAPAKAPVVKVQPVPKPVPDKTEEARKVAQKSGILALKDQLADLRDSTLPINNNQPLITGALSSKGGAGAASGNPDAIASSAAAGSGGISGRPNGVVGGEGAGVGTRLTGSVSSSIGGTGTGAGGSGYGASGGRTLAELQQVFDRNKAGFNSIFNKSQRDNPDMAAGKIVVNLTIAPDGSVIGCTLVSSSFHDPELEQRIIERVKLLNFGAKKVPVFNYPSYPINYIPG